MSVTAKGKRLRPLLTVKKEDVLRELHECGIRWREDRTNAGMAFFRNRIRHRVLPAWQEAAGRDAVSGAALARQAAGPGRRHQGAGH